MCCWTMLPDCLGLRNCFSSPHQAQPLVSENPSCLMTPKRTLVWYSERCAIWKHIFGLYWWLLLHVWCGIVYYITYKKKRHRIPWSFWVPAQDPALPDAINHQEGGDIKKPRRASGCGEFVRFLVRSMKLGVFLMLFLWTCRWQMVMMMYSRTLGYGYGSFLEMMFSYPRRSIQSSHGQMVKCRTAPSRKLIGEPLKRPLLASSCRGWEPPLPQFVRCLG